MARAREEKATVVKEFAIHGTDTGSMQVQVALLTQDIKLLTVHCQTHPQDHSSRRGLLQKVNQRKKFLKYLDKNDQAEYRSVVERLGLRK